jgi:hypothetical protein
MLVKGWVTAYWGTSETGRKVRFYRLTHDPIGYAGAIGMLVAIVVVAALSPARRALRLEVAKALHCD